MKCYTCGFFDHDYESCTCPSCDMWYACPIEAEKPENQEELKEYAEWVEERRESDETGNVE